MISLWIGSPYLNRFLNQKHLSTIYPTSSWSVQPGMTSKKTENNQTYSQSEIGLLFLSALIGSSLGLLYNTLALCDLTGFPAFELKESIKAINTHRNKSKEGRSCKMKNFFWIPVKYQEVKISLRIQISRSRTSSSCRTSYS